MSEPFDGDAVRLYKNKVLADAFMEISHYISVYVILGNVEEHIGLLMALEKKNLLQTGKCLFCYFHGIRANVFLKLSFLFVLGLYWVVGVNTETYTDREPDVYVRGLLKNHSDADSLRILRSYFSIIASAPIGYLNFTNKVNEYRQRPPFNFQNPLKNFKEEGSIQVTIYLSFITMDC